MQRHVLFLIGLVILAAGCASVDTDRRGSFTGFTSCVDSSPQGGYCAARGRAWGTM